jgi:hypothetical protein
LNDFFEFGEDDMKKFLEMKANLFRVDKDGYCQAIEYDEEQEFSLKRKPQKSQQV